MSPTVLVVEDEADLVVALRLVLRGAGYTVLATGSGLEALELIEQREPDAVILDLRLPDMHGLEVLARLRERSDGGRIPVLVCSAHVSPRTVRRAEDLGCADYITKPFDPEDLVRRLGAALERG